MDCAALAQSFRKFDIGPVHRCTASISHLFHHIHSHCHNVEISVQLLHLLGVQINEDLTMINITILEINSKNCYR